MNFIFAVFWHFTKREEKETTISRVGDPIEASVHMQEQIRCEQIRCVQLQKKTSSYPPHPPPPPTQSLYWAESSKVLLTESRSVFS